MTKTVQEQLAENQAVQFDQTMAIHTLVGNITHWRTNFRDNSATHRRVLTGRMKILNLIARFKV